MPDILPFKKVASDARKNGLMPPPEKKKSKTSPCEAEIKVVTIEEVTSANHATVLGPMASMLKNPAMAKKLLEGVILPIDKDEV